MAEAVKSLKPSGGDYATWALWEAAIPADQAADSPWVGEQQAAGDLGGCVFNVSFAFTAMHKMTVAEGYRFCDLAQWPVLDDVRGLGARIDHDSGFDCVQADSPGFIIEWLQLGSTTDNKTAVGTYAHGVDNLIVRRCVIWGQQYAIINWGWNDYGCLLHDTIFYDNSYGVVGYGNGPGIACYNVTSITGNSNGFVSFGGTYTPYNCIGDRFASPTGGNFNMSADGTATGATNWRNVTLADVLEAPTGAARDFHLQSSVDGTYEGGDYSDTIGAIDIDCTSRSDWDIGADEIDGGEVGGGGDPVAPLGAALHRVRPCVAPTPLEVLNRR